MNVKAKRAAAYLSASLGPLVVLALAAVPAGGQQNPDEPSRVVQPGQPGQPMPPGPPRPFLPGRPMPPGVLPTGVVQGVQPPQQQSTNQVYPPSGNLLGTPAGGGGGVEVESSGDITLNFVNADVRDVAKAVLGDYLKLNYEIASNVVGYVTIQTSKPLARAQVLPALEQALSLNGLALVHANGIYEVMPVTDAHKQVGATTPARTTTSTGFGVQVVPVKFVSAAAIAKVLEPLSATEGAIRVDPSRNVLIIEGTQQQRQTLIDDIAIFDADWLAGMSFALFEPTYMDADELAKELTDVVGGTDSPIAGVVRFVPIDRLNAVLAISPQQKYLEKLKTWVTRLDRPGNGNDKKIFVYRVQNGRASDIAATLLKTIFGQGSAQAQSAQPQANGPQQFGGVGGLNGGASPFGGSSSSGSSPFGSSSTGGTPGGTASGLGSSGSGTAMGGGLGSSSLGNMRPPQSATPFQPVTTPVEQAAAQKAQTVNGISLASVNITADETNNALVILATPREYGVVVEALHQLDVAPLQVLLEAAIAEITLTKDTAYGFQYFYKPNSTPNSTSIFGLTNATTLPNPPATPLAASLPGFTYMFSNGNSLNAVLSALGTETHTEVLSAPEVLVLNNQTASLAVGDQVPIVTATSISTIDTNAPQVNSVQYLNTGVILKVTPRVNKGGQVMMDIDQEVSQPTSTSSSTINSPTIQQREIVSTVSVEDGETIALGGLFSNQDTKTKNGIPFLQDIPYLGNLFRNTDINKNKDELLVLISPHVVDSTDKARAVTDELRRKMPELEPLITQPR